MKKKLFVVSLMCLLVAGGLFLAGCEDVWEVAADPNSAVNVGAEAADKVLPVVAVAAAAAGAAGLPWAPIILLVTNVLSALLLVYKNHQKNVTADKYENVRVTTEAIVDAITEVSKVKHEGGTVGGVVKAKIEEKLKDKDAYLIGKIVIDTLKAKKLPG